MLIPGEKDAAKRLTSKCTRLLTRSVRELRKEFSAMSMRGCPGVCTESANRLTGAGACLSLTWFFCREKQ